MFLRAREVEQWARVTQHVSSKGSSLNEPWWGPCLEKRRYENLRRRIREQMERIEEQQKKWSLLPVSPFNKDIKHPALKSPLSPHP